MTAKRFKCIDLIILDGFIMDNVENEHIDDENEIVELLNELHEEAKDNEHYHSEVLRLYKAVSEENEQLKQELHKIKVVNEMLSMDFSNSEHELWRENEQLKQQVQKIHKLINSKIQSARELGSVRTVIALKNLQRELNGDIE